MSGPPTKNREMETNVPRPTRIGQTAEKALFASIYHPGHTTIHA
jgi:hypothetical protein